MAQVYIGIGSNIDPEIHIRKGIASLSNCFGPLELSTVYETWPVGLNGDNFYNLVVGFNTDLTPNSIVDALRAIEDRFDRKRHECRHAPRNVDLDLLLYDDLVVNEDGLELPRGDIIRYAFVLCPLAEIAGDMRHPVNRKRFADLWHTFDKTGQKLWPVDTPFVSLNHTGDHSDV